MGKYQGWEIFTKLTHQYSYPNWILEVQWGELEVRLCPAESLGNLIKVRSKRKESLSAPRSIDFRGRHVDL